MDNKFTASNTIDLAGSCLYQLDLKKLKLMPYIDHMANGKGKRKVINEEDGQTPHSMQ